MKLIKITVQDVELNPNEHKLSEPEAVYLAENGFLNNAADYIRWFRQNPNYVPVEEPGRGGTMSELTDKQYIEALDSMFGGPDETTIRCRTIRIVLVAKPHACQCPDSRHDQHLIPAGNRAVLDRAIADDKWGSCYVCLPCLKSWHDHCEAGMAWCTEAEAGRNNPNDNPV